MSSGKEEIDAEAERNNRNSEENSKRKSREEIVKEEEEEALEKDLHPDIPALETQISKEELEEGNEETKEIESGKTAQYKAQLVKLIVPKKASKQVESKDEEGKTVTKWQIDPSQIDSDITPLLVFINRKSGGQQGESLLKKMRALLNPCQVFDLADGGPAPGLETYSSVPNTKILVAGGDGTAGWVLSVIDKVKMEHIPSVGVLPLGTGNDLARALGWGGGYGGQKIVPIIKKMESARRVELDRWTLNIANKKEDGTFEPPKLINIMNNYFSVGVDASIALEFHLKRQARPEKFTSRTYNKFSYSTIGGKAIFKNKAIKKGEVELIIDGKNIDIPNSTEGICVLNLDSYMGGANMWGSSKSKRFQPQSTSDGLIEVVAIDSSFHLGAIKSKLSSGKRLGQGKKVEMKLNVKIPTQVDGEPWEQVPSHVVLEQLNVGSMLARDKSRYPSPAPSQKNNNAN
eukprot:TRINITY_DN1791_c1_g1_i1.p1 TRINITY_DN1791_c1_g1~~TRINITY_DN1791_c1_g1_i1.p1  ORF type:complete len:460 (+),score=181.80 TRINITY_DN1791_c1_g1_i1:109-1488(+)